MQRQDRRIYANESKHHLLCNVAVDALQGKANARVEVLGYWCMERDVALYPTAPTPCRLGDLRYRGSLG